jgi:uncharacterized protein (DUF58 family)
MTRVRVRFGAVGVWLFGLAITYLAGLSLSGVLFYVFLLYLAFPLVSFLFLIIAYLRFRYFEYFSNDHPRKGEEVVYRLTLANEAPLSGAYVDVTFLSHGPDMSVRLPSIVSALGRRGTIRREYAIRFPYRGVYKVGMERLRLSDALSWLEFFAEVWYRTFYVYPRVIELHGVFPALSQVLESSGEDRGHVPDHTLYTDLREYRAGEPLRMMAWRKFAAAGTPFLKEVERTSWPGVELYLDLRRERAADRTVLVREDCSLEILVALYHFFLKRQTPVGAHAWNGSERFDFSGRDLSAFPPFYKATINIAFAGAASPLPVILSDAAEGRLAAATLVVVTHEFDPELLELAAGAADVAGGSAIGSAAAVSVFIVVNQTGMTEDERLAHQRFARTVPGLAGRIAFIDDPDRIREGLEQ